MPVTTPSAPRPSCSQLASSASSANESGVEQPLHALAHRQLALLRAFSWWRSGPPPSARSSASCRSLTGHPLVLPADGGRAPGSLARAEGHDETSASRRSVEVPGVATGSCAVRAPSVSTRQGTSPPATVNVDRQEGSWKRAGSLASTGPARSTPSCVVDADGRIAEGRRYRHDERGIRALCARLIELGVLLVAVERPDGLLIERLLDAGLHVIAVHPNQVAASRPRFSAAGGKSDSFDAFVLAELARADSHRFRVLVPDTDATKALRALTRAREDLVETRVALANTLTAQLECFWPGADRDLRRDRQPDRPGLPQALPQPGRRPRPRRATPGTLPGTPPLLRPPPRPRAARQTARRSRRPRRHA